MRHLEPNREPVEIEKLDQLVCTGKPLESADPNNLLTFIMRLEAYSSMESYIGPMGELTDYSVIATAPLELYEKCRIYPGVNMDKAIEACSWASREITQRRVDGLDAPTFDTAGDRQPTIADFDNLSEQFEKGEMDGDSAKLFHDRLVDFLMEYQTAVGIRWEDRLIDADDHLEPGQLLEIVRSIIKFSD